MYGKLLVLGKEKKDFQYLINCWQRELYFSPFAMYFPQKEGEIKEKNGEAPSSASGEFQIIIRLAFRFFYRELCFSLCTGGGGAVVGTITHE